jgi:hypothetical protein
VNPLLVVGVRMPKEVQECGFFVVNTMCKKLPTCQCVSHDAYGVEQENLFTGKIVQLRFRVLKSFKEFI